MRKVYITTDIEMMAPVQATVELILNLKENESIDEVMKRWSKNKLDSSKIVYMAVLHNEVVDVVDMIDEMLEYNEKEVIDFEVTDSK